MWRALLHKLDTNAPANTQRLLGKRSSNQRSLTDRPQLRQATVQISPWSLKISETYLPTDVEVFQRWTADTTVASHHCSFNVFCRGIKKKFNTKSSGEILPECPRTDVTTYKKSPLTVLANWKYSTFVTTIFKSNFLLFSSDSGTKGQQDFLLRVDDICTWINYTSVSSFRFSSQDLPVKYKTHFVSLFHHTFLSCLFDSCFEFWYGKSV